MRSKCGASRGALLSLTLVIGAGSGHAEDASPEGASIAPLPSDTDEARTAFRQGSALAKRGQWADALLAFQRSARLRPHPVTTYDVAYCERALGHDVRAARGFAAALAPARAPGAAALPPELALQAERLLDEVRRRIAHVEVTLGRPDLTVRVDGAPLVLATPNAALTTDVGGDTGARDGAPLATYVVGDEGASDGAPLPSRFGLDLDAGSHVFVIVGPHLRKVAESHRFASGATSTLMLPADPDAFKPVEVPERSPLIQANALPSRVHTTGAYVAWGVGAAGLITAGVFGALALSERHILNSDPRCANQACPDEPHYQDVEARFGRYSDFATASLSVGVVGAAVGAVLWLTRGPTAVNPQAAQIEVGGTGLRGRF